MEILMQESEILNFFQEMAISNPWNQDIDLINEHMLIQITGNYLV